MRFSQHCNFQTSGIVGKLAIKLSNSNMEWSYVRHVLLCGTIEFALTILFLFCVYVCVKMNNFPDFCIQFKNSLFVCFRITVKQQCPPIGRETTNDYLVLSELFGDHIHFYLYGICCLTFV